MSSWNIGLSGLILDNDYCLYCGTKWRDNNFKKLTVGRVSWQPNQSHQQQLWIGSLPLFWSGHSAITKTTMKSDTGSYSRPSVKWPSKLGNMSVSDHLLMWPLRSDGTGGPIRGYAIPIIDLTHKPCKRIRLVYHRKAWILQTNRKRHQ